jgi:hypothetical protein
VAFGFARAGHVARGAQRRLAPGPLDINQLSLSHVRECEDREGRQRHGLGLRVSFVFCQQLTVDNFARSPYPGH